LYGNIFFRKLPSTSVGQGVRTESGNLRCTLRCFIFGMCASLYNYSSSLPAGRRGARRVSLPSVCHRRSPAVFAVNTRTSNDGVSWSSNDLPTVGRS